jgi:putative addiction module component (TIGR02574 family)
MESTDQLAKKAIGLRPTERIRLVEAILYSLDKPDPDIEKSWIAEAEARYEAYKRGELAATDWDEILITAVAHLHRDAEHYKDRSM